MKYSLSSEHLELSEIDVEMLEKKLNVLHKHLVPPFTTDIRFTHDTHHSKGNVVTCTIKIVNGKQVFHVDRSAPSVQDSIDETIAAMQNVLSRSRGKKKEHRS